MSQNANSIQVDGTHYKVAFEHWDFVVATHMRYLEGCATKYTLRHRKKNGAADLRKAMHYVDKITQLHKANKYISAASHGAIFDRDILNIGDNVYKLQKCNNLGDVETAIIRTLARWQSVHDLAQVKAWLASLLAQYAAA